MNYTELFQVHGSKSEQQSFRLNLMLAQSIVSFVNQSFVQLAPYFVLTMSCYRKRFCSLQNDLVENLFRNWGSRVIQLVRYTRHFHINVPGRRLVNLVLVDSFESFETIDIISYTKDYHTNEYYYIVLHGEDQKEVVSRDMQRIFEYCWKHFIIHCNVQIQTAKEEILIYSYYPFTEGGCRTAKPKIINKFVDDNWESSIMFPEKLLNFYGCSLVVATWHVPPFMYLTNYTNGSLGIKRGVDARLMFHMAERLNFSIEVKVPPNDEQRGIVKGNTVTGALLMLKNKDVDLSLGFYRHAEDRLRFVSATISYHQTAQVIAVPLKAYKFSSLEILLYPFSNVVWSLVVMINIFAVFLIYFLNRFHHRYPQLFADCTIKYSYISIFLLLVGMPLEDIPKRLIMRYLIVAWMTFSLVVRTLYQALLFHQIHVQVTNSVPTTFAQLIEGQYTLVLDRTMRVALDEVPVIKQLNLITLNDTNNITPFVYVETHKGTHISAAGPLDFLKYYVTKEKKNGVFAVVPESLVGIQLTVYMSKHSFLIDRFNEEIQWILAMGLEYAWQRKEHDFDYIRRASSYQHEFLGFDELYMVFVIWILGLIIATICFALELLSKKYKWKSLQNLFSAS